MPHAPSSAALAPRSRTACHSSMSEKPFYSTSIREEELKNKVAADWFGIYDTTRIIGNIDFCVDVPATELALGYDAEPILWAEAKAGNRKDIVASFVQLILTIGGEHTADRHLPPKFLGAFDAQRIAFLPYNAVLHVFGQNDFNWNVAPSDHETKEFKELYSLAETTIRRERLLFDFAEDAAALRRFIKANFKSGRSDISKILINKNNFTHIYRQWREAVMPLIAAPWDVLKKKYNIYDRDFYLAEMNIDDNGTPEVVDDKVANDFYITFDACSSTPYNIRRKNEDDLFNVLAFGFKPGGLDAYSAFWRRYKRPPRKDYWDFIVNRLDLLVPQDVRERKGSFFTPKKWVELSQHYLELELGPDWQDEYYIWDCCAGTGNLLAGLNNKYRIWASTLDQQDVEVMRERIKGGANLLDSHVFQFDFLNDSFDSLPQGLKEIIDDPEKRKKLVVYINPPYAEAGNKKMIPGTIQPKSGVSFESLAYKKYKPIISSAARELFALFLMRISSDISGCVVGQFSTLKHLQGTNFKHFRKVFRGRVGRSFLAPANTFDNVSGKFPIGFFIWRLNDKDVFAAAHTDLYDSKSEFIGTKSISSYAEDRNVIEWLREGYDRHGDRIAYLRMNGTNVQNNEGIFISQSLTRNDIANRFYAEITRHNVARFCVYYAVRKCIEVLWYNYQDQYLCPNTDVSADFEFVSDCEVFSLFGDKNFIKSADGVNHWIPFTEAEVGAKDCFKSHFMSEKLTTLNSQLTTPARAVLDAGRELWRYYHAQPDANPDASYYDIRLYFQGSTTDAKGKVKMNSSSGDATYTRLLGDLRAAMKRLAAHIEPKVYAYGFLKG